MQNKINLGPERTPAAILQLWSMLYMLAQVLVINVMSFGTAYAWLLRLCHLGFAILLFRGKKTVGFMILAIFQTILSLWNLINSFGVERLIFLASDAALLVIVIFASIPSFEGRKNPLRNLEFIPACLFFLPYIIIFLTNMTASVPIKYGGIFYANALLHALAIWLMGRALTTQSTAQSAPAYATGYAPVPTYAPPQPQAPTAQPASTQGGPGTLLVRFSIDALNKLSGSYGFQSGKLIGQVVPPALLEGMTISDGDSAATLQGREYVCIVSLSTPTNHELLKEQIEPRIAHSEQIKKCGAFPLTQLVPQTNEPLVADGTVRGGRIEGPGGWCANGFASAWKEQAEGTATVTL
ncbi:MAG: hypothetical protein ACOX2M_08530 [Fastidiosipilaceae bacterium]|jgi:hypothetical protein